MTKTIMPGLRKTVLGGFMGAFLILMPVLAAPAHAQFETAPVPTERLQPTIALEVAMIFSRMTGQQPDFEEWVKGMREYQEATEFSKTVVIEQRLPELRQRYSLLSYEDPVVVEEIVALSRYSPSKKGFFIETFSPDTFYSFKYLDKDYALIPNNIMDHQWVGVADDAEGKALERQLSTGATALMQIQLTPKSADNKAPLRIGNKEFWLMSADIKKVALFTGKGELLWESGALERKEKAQQELLNLYQAK